MGASNDERVIGDIFVVYDYRSSNDSKYPDRSVDLGVCDRVSDVCIAEFFLFEYSGIFCIVSYGSFGGGT